VSLTDCLSEHDALIAFCPPWARRALADAGIRIRVVEPGETFADASPALRRLGVDVDAWPIPPAGLFIVEERALLLRTTSPLTVAHELGHALDCALGGGTYRSGYDPAIRSAFAAASAFVSPYAATGLDEYFAEGFRAWCGVNDDGSPWPEVSRERLREVDPALYAVFAALEGEDE
jgi:hypothetical protein